MESSLHVICFGNLLQGDDGFGIHVHRRLCREAWPPGVRLFDAGITGLGALAHFDGCRLAVVVDALGDMGCPGRVHRLALDQLAGPAAAFSSHALDLNHLFHVLPILFEGKRPPEIVVIGAEIEPPSGAFSMELSAPAARAVDDAAALVREEARAWAASRRSSAEGAVVGRALRD